jgi:cellulose synthase/poly-beta-1,6-N-acetylglucosamine synthase-like glycosyltransferase
MNHNQSCSVVIPSNHDPSDLLKVVQAVCNQTIKPAEIVIVDSSGKIDPTFQLITEMCGLNTIELNYVRCQNSLPGQARNIGLSLSKYQLISFIDVKTIPRTNWIEESLNCLKNQDLNGVWGSTCFSANSAFGKIVRDGLHGVLPQKTLPGSVFRREIFNKVGQFIPLVRAGEDTDWMLRVKLLNLNVIFHKSPLIDYEGLDDLNAINLFRKWYRNYTASSELPHILPQKLILWQFIYPLLILIGLNWNYLIADWKMDSPFYIGHITKIIAMMPFAAYILLRGIYLPFKRGVKIRNLLPFRFLTIALVCFVLDIIKVIVFAKPKSKSKESN